MARLGPRSQQPVKRWTNPASLLQAARFQQRMTQQAVIAQLRQRCPGHGKHACGVTPSNLSDWERGRQPPTTRHIQVLCEIFQRSAEDLGLITWRTPEQRAQAEREARAQLEREIRARLEPEIRAQLECEAHARHDRQASRTADAEPDLSGLLVLIGRGPEQTALLRKLIALFQDFAGAPRSRDGLAERPRRVKPR